MVRPIWDIFTYNFKHQNTDEIAIRQTDLKKMHFEKFLFYKSKKLIYVEGFSYCLHTSKTCNCNADGQDWYFIFIFY